MNDFLIGSDPEVFLRDENNNPVAACGLLPGDKETPYDYGNGLKGQVDNVALEYNTIPTNNRDSWAEQHLQAQELFNRILSSRGLHLAIEGSVIFPSEALDHPDAWVFGCNPDFNVWDMETSANPTHPDKCFRSAGGHIHLGISGGLSREQSIKAGMFADILIGQFLFHHEDKADIERRKFYGKAGSIRFKPYGIEYRTPSNVWIRKPELLKPMFEYSVRVIQNTLASEATVYDIQDEMMECVTKMINEHSASNYNRVLSKIESTGFLVC